MKKFNVLVNGETFEVEVEDLSGGVVAAPAVSAPPPAVAQVEAAPVAKPAAPAASAPAAAPAGGGSVSSPMPGNIWKVLVKKGDQVTEGQPIIILEAMKMENEIGAPCAGTVKEIAVEEGQAVSRGALLAVVG